MNIEELLDQIEDVLEAGTNFPFSSKSLIKVEAIKTSIEDIRMNLPNEISQAKAIVADQRNIISKAQHESVDVVARAKEKAEKALLDTENKVRSLISRADDYSKKKVLSATEEANNILSSAQARAKQLVEEHEITLIAKDNAAQIKRQTQNEANAMLLKAKEQVDELLSSARDEKDKAILAAKERADTLTAEAEKWSSGLRASSGDYAERMMKATEETLSSSLNKVREAMQKVQDIKNNSKQ